MKNLKTKLIYLFYTFSLITFIISCSVDSSRIEQDRIERGFGGGIKILKIDGCEYIWVKRGYGGGLTHKGNCDNPEHKIKKY